MITIYELWVMISIRSPTPHTALHLTNVLYCTNNKQHLDQLHVAVLYHIVVAEMSCVTGDISLSVLTAIFQVNLG